LWLEVGTIWLGMTAILSGFGYYGMMILRLHSKAGPGRRFVLFGIGAGQSDTQAGRGAGDEDIHTLK
jgi:hypothetical protein